jgi:DNA recombination-dependent growth factor C
VDKTEKEKHTEYVSLLESKYAELENKELSLWDKYSEEKMPKQVFDKLMAKCIEEKQSIENALETAYNEVPVQIDYKGAISSLHKAIETLNDDSVPASAKNKILLCIVDKIVYRRPKAIRMTPQEAEEKGITLNGSWYCPDFELDIHLKV